MVHPLPQDLNRGLGPVLLLGGHVEIVDKYDALVAKRWAKDTLAPLPQLACSWQRVGMCELMKATLR